MLDRARIVVTLTQDRLLARRFGDDLAALAGGLPALRHTAVLGTGSWDDLAAAAAAADPADLRARAAAVAPGDDALVVFSSGTTSAPKAVVHGHTAPTRQFRVPGPDVRPPRADPDVARAAAVLDGRPHTPSAAPWPPAAAASSRRRSSPARRSPSWPASGSPSPTRSPTRPPPSPSTPAGPAPTCRRSPACTASAPSPATRPSAATPAGACRSATGCRRPARSSPPTRSDTPRERARASSGRLLPGNQLRVLDPATGAPLGPGEVGELAVTGPTLMHRYLGTRPGDRLDADGFFRTGDLGWVDDGGDLHFEGRATEMIQHRAAPTCRPAEIEVQLRACPPVKLSRVVGVPDPRARRDRRRLRHAQGRRRRHRGRHPRLPPRPGGRATRFPGGSCSSTTARSP